MGHLLRRIGRAQRRALVFILCQIGGLPLTGARSYQFLASKSNIKAQGMGEHGSHCCVCRLRPSVIGSFCANAKNPAQSYSSGCALSGTQRMPDRFYSLSLGRPFGFFQSRVREPANRTRDAAA